MTRVAVVRDPYPEFARRRGLGAAVVEEGEATPEGPRQWFGVYRWDAVRAALSDEALSAGLYHEAMGLDRRYGDLLIGMDDPEHRAHRAVLQRSFSRASVAVRLRSSVGTVIDRLVADLAEASGPGATDLWSSLCEPLPALVLTGLFGVDDALAPLLRSQAAVLTTDASTLPAAAVSASDELQQVLAPVIADRRARPATDDLVAVLAHGRLGGRALTDDEVFCHLRLLAIAGTDTVSRALANLLFALLDHPQQLAAVRADPTLAPAAVEEAVRWETPAVSVPRVARRDTRIGDVAIPAGAAVRCCLSSANHDGTRWTDPDRYDLHRAPLAHAGFGMGAHACLGLHLAQLVMGQTLTALLAALPGLRFDPEAPPALMAGEHLRTPTHLRVRWG